jgi:hypothetical protein
MIGISDLDREILLKIKDDKQFMEMCSLNKYMSRITNDESFWKRRILSRFGKIFYEEEILKFSGTETPKFSGVKTCEKTIFSESWKKKPFKNYYLYLLKNMNRIIRGEVVKPKDDDLNKLFNFMKENTKKLDTELSNFKSYNWKKTLDEGFIIFTNLKFISEKKYLYMEILRKEFFSYILEKTNVNPNIFLERLLVNNNYKDWILYENNNQKENIEAVSFLLNSEKIKVLEVLKCFTSPLAFEKNIAELYIKFVLKNGNKKEIAGLEKIFEMRKVENSKYQNQKTNDYNIINYKINDYKYKIDYNKYNYSLK